MPTYLIEVESSTLTSYKVEADNATNARMMAKLGNGYIVEEHDDERITSCVEVPDDDD